MKPPVLRPRRKLTDVLENIVITADPTAEKRDTEQDGRQNQVMQNALHFQKSQMAQTT